MQPIIELCHPDGFDVPHWMGYRIAENLAVFELSGIVLVNFKGTGSQWRQERLVACPRLDKAIAQLGLPAPGPGYCWTMSPRKWTVFAAPVALSNEGQAVNAGWAVDRFGADESQFPLTVEFPFFADLCARDVDGVLWRVGYRIWCLGEMRQERKHRQLTFTVQGQQQTNWCWAAVAVSIALFYDPGSTWTQCSLVNAELGQTTCCTNGATSQCDRPWFLDNALTRVGNLDHVTAGSVALSALEQEIDSCRLAGVRIGWTGGGGHFVVIEGYQEDGAGAGFLHVEDPFFGPSYVAYTTFRTAYQGTGSWTYTYFTRG